jgi:hypothetical protein
LQTLPLPDNLPKGATGVRVIVVQLLQAGLDPTIQGFAKIWTEVKKKEFLHFIFRARMCYQFDFCQAQELYFPIDPENRKIYADLSNAGGLNEGHGYYTVQLFLVGYTV